MRNLLLATTLAAATVFSFSASANQQVPMSNFNYDYFDARIGLAPITFGAGISKSIHPNAHFVAHIDSELDNDYNGSVGLGFHAPINNWADLTGAMKLRIADNREEDPDAGMEINLGVRQWLGPQLEVGGTAGYVSIFGDDRFIGVVSGRFHATELFSIGLEGKLNELYGDQFMITTRFNF
jgi:hypothetical protein